MSSDTIPTEDEKRPAKLNDEKKDDLFVIIWFVSLVSESNWKSVQWWTGAYKIEYKWM